MLFNAIDGTVPQLVNSLGDGPFPSARFEDAQTVLEFSLGQKVAKDRWWGWKVAPDAVLPVLAIELAEPVDGQDISHESWFLSVEGCAVVKGWQGSSPADDVLSVINLLERD